MSIKEELREKLLEIRAKEGFAAAEMIRAIGISPETWARIMSDSFTGEMWPSTREKIKDYIKKYYEGKKDVEY